MSSSSRRPDGAHGCRACGRPAPRWRCHGHLLRQRRSRSHTRSIARRQACEQNRCRGLRRWRTKHSSQPGRSQLPSKKILRDDPRRFRSRLFLRLFSGFQPFPVAPALPVPFLFARRRSPPDPPSLPLCPLARLLLAVLTTISLACMSRTEPLFASLEQTLPRPRPAHCSPAPTRRLLFEMPCRILGRAHGR